MPAVGQDSPPSEVEERKEMKPPRVQQEEREREKRIETGQVNDVDMEYLATVLSSRMKAAALTWTTCRSIFRVADELGVVATHDPPRFFRMPGARPYLSEWGRMEEIR